MFKKSMAALAVLSLSAGLASASEVTLYGIVDNGLLYKHSKVETNGVSTKTDSFALETGISSPSLRHQGFRRSWQRHDRELQA